MNHNVLAFPVKTQRRAKTPKAAPAAPVTLMDHSGLIETWEAFLLRDVGARSARGVRVLPRVRVTARTGYDAVTGAVIRFSEKHGLVIDRDDVGVRKLAAA
jgi:hypothetical protein